MIQLRGITWQHKRGYDPLVATAIRYHTLHPEVVIEWEQMPWLEFATTTRRELASDVGRYDLIVYDHPWVGEYRDWLVALEELMTDEQKMDLESDADAASLESYRYEGHLYALPIDAACHVVAYRPDLLGKYADSLPGDWDSMLRLAREFHRPPNRFGLTIAWGPVDAFLFLISVAAALGDKPFVEPGRGLDSEAGQRSLQLMRDIRQLCIEDARHPYDLMVEESRVAISPAVFAYINYYKNLMGIADEPVMAESGQRTAMLGGMGLGIARSSHHQDEAWQYAWYVMSREVQSSVFLKNEGQPGRISALKQADQSHTGFGSVLIRALEGCFTRPRYAGWFYIEQACGDIIMQHLTGKLTAAETLNLMQSSVNTILRSRRKRNTFP